MINWKAKLSSRKFWALITGVAVSCSALIGINDDITSKIVAVIGSVSSVAIYILGEAYVDGKRVGQENK